MLTEKQSQTRRTDAGGAGEEELHGRSSGYICARARGFLIRVYHVLTWAGPMLAHTEKLGPAGIVYSPERPKVMQRDFLADPIQNPTVAQERALPFPFSPPRSRRAYQKSFSAPLSNCESSGNYHARRVLGLGKRGTRRNPPSSRSTFAVDSTGARRREFLSASSFSLLLDPQWRST